MSCILSRKGSAVGISDPAAKGRHSFVSRAEVVETLAFIRSVSPADLERDSKESGESLPMTSLEAVAILIKLQDTTGINPKSRDVLRRCGDITTLDQLLELIDRKREGTP